MSSSGRMPRVLARLRTGAGARRLRPQEEIHRESALPADLFECQEPMVEAAVMDAAARVFLDKLGHPTLADAAPLRSLPDLAAVDQAAIEACLVQFRELGDEAPPDLMCGLDDERLWVLVDLARHGSGLGRQRATHELRQLLRELGVQAEDNRTLLEVLAERLTDEMRGGGYPVVFQALLLEVRTALRRLQVGEEPQPA